MSKYHISACAALVYLEPHFGTVSALTGVRLSVLL
jgi:hypothetical protein